jgi:hypothetical protein
MADQQLSGTLPTLPNAAWRVIGGRDYERLHLVRLDRGGRPLCGAKHYTPAWWEEGTLPLLKPCAKCRKLARPTP